MATVRYLVRDVDAALPFYEAHGFTLADRSCASIVMLERCELALWPDGRSVKQVPVEDPSGNPIELFEAKNA